jgi:hypothetical protein
VTDGAAIYRIVNGTPTRLIKPHDLPPPPPLAVSSFLRALAIDANDVLYALRSEEGDSRSMASEILSWDGVHPMKVLRVLPSITDPRAFVALGADAFGILSLEGLSTSTAAAATTILFSTAGLKARCQDPSLAAAGADLLFYATGCAAFPRVFAAPVDGSALIPLQISGETVGSDALTAVGADPAGGVVGVFEGKKVARFPRIGPARTLPTSPALDVIGTSIEQAPPSYQGLAVGRSWRIYLVTLERVILAEPIW